MPSMVCHGRRDPGDISLCRYDPGKAPRCKTDPYRRSTGESPKSPWAAEDRGIPVEGEVRDAGEVAVKSRLLGAD